MTGRTGGNGSTQAQPERVMLVGVMLDKDGTGSSAARLNGFQTALAEAVELVKAAGGDSVRVETAKRDRPHTALFVGTGKAAELSEAVAADGIDLVVFNHELTPTQERNLEKELKCRVLDRVGLILAIFARRALRRKSRESGTIKTFALVGYTNVGKSSLFNRLTKSGIYAKDQLFATLDTTARRLYISPECSIILTDTVGFVSDLPHKLISAFSATLEETAQADVLLHVVDAAAPNSGQQIEDVENVLQEIHAGDAGDIPCIKVYNKTDLLPSEEQNTGIWRDAAGKIAAVRISVAENTGIDALREAIAESCAAAPNTDETEMP